MKITDLLKKDGIELNAVAADQNGAIDKLIELHSKVGNLTDAAKFKEAILAREAKGSTAIGMGIAVPHGKSAAVAKAGLTAITIPAGIDYKSLDGNPSKLFFMIAAPDTAADTHLEVLSKLMTLLMDQSFSQKLIDAKTTDEFLQIIDDLGTEEGRSVFQSGFIYDNGGALGLDALHDTLDGRLPEVVGICFHGQAVHTDDDVFLSALFVAGVRLAVAVSAGDFQNAVGDKVLSRAVCLDDRFDEVFGHVLIVGEQLLGIFWQAVTAVAKGRVVVVIADARIKADTLNDLSGVQALDLCIGVQLVEVADAQRQISVDEQLRGFSLGGAHEKSLDILLVGTLLQQRNEDVGLLSGVVGSFIIADDDPAGIQVVIQGLGFAQELRAEQDVVDAEFFADVPGVSYRNGRLNDDCRLILRRFVCRGLHDKLYNSFHSTAVKEILLGIIVGRRSHNDKIRVFISLSCIRSCLEAQLSRSLFRFSQKLLNILIPDRRFIIVELLHFLRNDIHRGDVVVLGEQNSEGQTDVAGSGDGDLVGGGSGEMCTFGCRACGFVCGMFRGRCTGGYRFVLLIDEEICRFKT